MLELLKNILVYSGGAVVVSFLIFKFLGKKWLEGIFEKNLENFKQNNRAELERIKLLHNTELEKLKLGINSSFNRITIIHEREYEIIPETWKKLVNTIHELESLTSYLKYYPDLNNYDKSQLDNFYENQKDLTEYDKISIIKADDKLKVYKEIMVWKSINKSHNLLYSLHDYIRQNIIFFNDELKISLDQMCKLIKSAIINWESATEFRNPDSFKETHEIVENKIRPLVDKIELEIKEKLQNLKEVQSV